MKECYSNSTSSGIAYHNNNTRERPPPDESTKVELEQLKYVIQTSPNSLEKAKAE